MKQFRNSIYDRLAYSDHREIVQAITDLAKSNPQELTDQHFDLAALIIMLNDPWLIAHVLENAGRFLKRESAELVVSYSLYKLQHASEALLRKGVLGILESPHLGPLYPDYLRRYYLKEK